MRSSASAGRARHYRFSMRVPGANMAYHASTCPFCACGCTLLLHEEAGELQASYPRVGPGSRATLCMRGWNCISSVSHPDRLRVPLVRGANGLLPVSWQAAVDEVAARLRQAASPPLIAAGPVVANEDAFAIRRLACRIGARLCCSDLSGTSVARRALGATLGRGYGLTDLDAVAGADLIWVVGCDLDECPQLASRVVAARRSGGTMVRFDVHASAPGSATTTVTVPPDRFGLLPLMLQQAIVDADLAAAEARSAPGFDDLARAWRTASPIIDPTGIARDEVASAVRAFAAADRPVVIVGSRFLTSAGADASMARFVEAIALLGASDRLLAAVGEANSWGCLDMLGPDVPAAEIACREQGLDTLVVVGDDLVGRSPRPDTLARTLEGLQTVVVIDRYTSDTMRFADVVLPSCTFAEVDGTVTNVCGALQRWRAAVAPPGDCCPERTWIARLGRALGVGDWPDTPRAWFEALRGEADGYRHIEPDALYGAESTSGAAPLDPAAAPRVAGDTRLAFAPVDGRHALADRAAETTFPLRLVLGTHMAHWSAGAISRREDLLAREAPTSVVSASPAAIEATGVRAGASVRLLVPDGEATLTIRADPRLPPDVLVLASLAGSPSWRLRGHYPSSGGHSVGVQPVPARLERA